MSHVRFHAGALALACLLSGAAVMAEPHGDEHRGPAQHAAPARGGPAHGPAHGEPHQGPTGYARVQEPKGWNARPQSFDKGAYQHNFQASRSFKIGPYHPPRGYVARRWGFGDILPRLYWGSQYLIADYWLFSLEVPPAGYEWVRVGPDALLISTVNGEVLQTEYGVFG